MGFSNVEMSQIKLRIEPQLTQSVDGYTSLKQKDQGHTTEIGMPELPMFSTLYQIDPFVNYEVSYTVVTSGFQKPVNREEKRRLREGNLITREVLRLLNLV